MTFGPLTVERHRELAAKGIHLQVFIAGQDVTRLCHFADDTPGHEVAELFKEKDGKKYIDPATQEVAIEIITSGVEIRQRAAL